MATGCSFVAPALPATVSGQVPTFSYNGLHFGDFLGVQMTFMTGTTTCYGAVPSGTPYLTNTAASYSRNCFYNYIPNILGDDFTNLACPGAAITGIPSGPLTINYKNAGPNPPRPFVANFGPSPLSVKVTVTSTTTVNVPVVTTTLVPAATATAYVDGTPFTRQSTFTVTQTSTRISTVSASSCPSPSGVASSSSTRVGLPSLSIPSVSTSSPSIPLPSSISAPSVSVSMPAAPSKFTSVVLSSSRSSLASSSAVPGVPVITVTSTVVNTVVVPPSAVSSVSSVISSPSAIPTSSPSLSCPDSDGSLYSTSKGVFVVECYQDRYDSDIGQPSNPISNYEQCIDACAATTSCQTVSYVPNGPCYLKNGVGAPNQNSGVWGARLASASISSSLVSTPAVSSVVPSLTSAIASAITSAAAQPRPSVSCPGSDGDIIVTSAGPFQVECGVDRYNFDMSDSPVFPSSYEGCVAACADRTGCRQVSYVSGGPCYLKSGSGSPNVNSGIIGGRLLTPDSGSSVALPVSTSVALPVSSSAAAPLVTSVPGTTGASCPGSDGQILTTECGATFAVECASDRVGGDFGPVEHVNSLAECLAVCDNNPGCIDVSFVNGRPGPCYIKNELRPIVQNTNISGGRRLTDCNTNPLGLHRKRVVHQPRDSQHLQKRLPFGPDFTFIQQTSTSIVPAIVTVGRATSTVTARPTATITITATYLPMTSAIITETKSVIVISVATICPRALV